MRVFKMNFPQILQSCLRIILSVQQARPCEFKRNYSPSFNYLEEFKLGKFPRIKKIISRGKFYLSSPIYTARQTSDSPTSALLMVL